MSTALLSLTESEQRELPDLALAIGRPLAEGTFASLRDKIRAEKQGRHARALAFARLYELADKAARSAAERHTPTPMTVVEHANAFDDASPVVRSYGPYEAGVCGFAWVNVRPSTSAFARWLREERGWRVNSYDRATQLWVITYGQSMERKEAYARTMAEVLRASLTDTAVRVSTGSRMD